MSDFLFFYLALKSKQKKGKKHTHGSCENEAKNNISYYS